MNTKPKSNLRDILYQLPRLLLIYSFIAAIISGVLIACYYVPTPQSAALSISTIQEYIFAGTSILKIHRICGVLVILFTLLNCGVILPGKKISKPWIRTGQSGILLLILFFSFVITGYLLLGNNTAAFIMKSLLKKVSAQPHFATSQHYSDALSLIFIRVYVLHVVILPVAAGWILYKHVKNTEHFFDNLYPVSIHPLTLGSLFTAVLIGISFFIRPIEEPVACYSEDFLVKAPWVIRNLAFIGKTIPVPVIIVSILLLFLLIWFAGYILGKGNK